MTEGMGRIHRCNHMHGRPPLGKIKMGAWIVVFLGMVACYGDALHHNRRYRQNQLSPEGSEGPSNVLHDLHIPAPPTLPDLGKNMQYLSISLFIY